MKKLLSIVTLAAVLSTGCGIFQPAADPTVAQCRKDVVTQALGTVGSTLLEDVLTGKLNLVTAMQQLGFGFNTVVQAVAAYNDCAPKSPTNLALPRFEDFKK